MRLLKQFLIILGIAMATASTTNAAEHPDGGVLVFGGTRNTGLETVKLLKARAEAVTVFVRPTSDRSLLEPLGVDYAVGDALNADEVLTAFKSGRFRAVISSLGGSRGSARPDYEGTRNIVDGAKATGVDRMIIVTAIGTGDSMKYASERTMQFLGEVLKIKTKGEDYLIDSGLDYSILRPGGLISEPATGNGVLSEDRKSTGSVHRADVALLVVQMLDEDGHSGKIYHVFDRDMRNMTSESR